MKRSRIRFRSKKTAKLYREKRVPMIVEMIEAHTACEIGPILMKETHYIGCSRVATTFHEKRKRSAGGSITNRENLMASCSTCNYYVEDFPEISHSLGLVLREGDPGWDKVAKRNDD